MPRTSQKEPAKWTLPGFGGKSRVLTSFGHLPIEALRRNDPLKTSSGSYTKVTWIDSIGLDAEFLSSHSQAQPIYIPAGSFGGIKAGFRYAVVAGAGCSCILLPDWSGVIQNRFIACWRRLYFQKTSKRFHILSFRMRHSVFNLCRWDLVRDFTEVFGEHRIAFASVAEPLPTSCIQTEACASLPKSRPTC